MRASLYRLFGSFCSFVKCRYFTQLGLSIHNHCYHFLSGRAIITFITFLIQKHTCDCSHLIQKKQFFSGANFRISVISVNVFIALGQFHYSYQVKKIVLTYFCFRDPRAGFELLSLLNSRHSSIRGSPVGSRCHRATRGRCRRVATEGVAPLAMEGTTGRR